MKDKFTVWGTIALVWACLAATAFTQEPTPPNQKFKSLIANVACSSGTTANGQTIPDFEAWAKVTGPIFQSRGITRITLHNPNGIGWAVAGDIKPWRLMRPDQWLIAEIRGKPYADRKKFAAAIQILKDHGITQIIVYIGSPALLKNPEIELPWCVEPFLDHPNKEMIAFGFDAMFYDGYSPGEDPNEWRRLWAPDAPCTQAVKALRLRGHRIYAEPRLRPEQLDFGLDRLIDGTMATTGFDAIPKRKAEWHLQKGEKIRRTIEGNRTCLWWPEIKDWEDDCTPWLMSGCNWYTNMNKVPVEEFFKR